MKVRIDNWGPIEHCEYDLDKDMIVVYGDNNIGKSYAMQLIYLYKEYRNVQACFLFQRKH